MWSYLTSGAVPSTDHKKYRYVSNVCVCYEHVDGLKRRW